MSQQALYIHLGGKYQLFGICPAFKVGLSPFKKKFVIYFIKSPLKVMRNVFYFILKDPSVLKILKFLSWIFGHRGLIRKIRLTSKFMTSQLGSQAITIHTLPNISQSKGTQTLKLDQLIKYNNKNIFLQKYAENEERRLVLDPF